MKSIESKITLVVVGLFSRAQVGQLWVAPKLSGTGFKEDLDDVFKNLEVTLRKRDYDTRNLDRKILDVN
jgi:hypothetical protein